MPLIKTLLDRFTSIDVDDDQTLDESDAHAQNVGPASIRLESDATRSGDQWVKTLMITDWPDTANPGHLDTITTHPSADVGLSIHAEPRETEQAITQVENAIRDLQTVHRGKQENGDPSIGLTERRISDHEDVLTQLTDESQSIFDVSAYLPVRGESKEQVEKRCQRIRAELEKQQLTVRSVDYDQSDGLVSASPVAKDTISEWLPSATTPMLGSALGALFPFSASTLIEESGVLYGYHATTDAPVVVDRFQRPNGYNVLAAAQVGSGKSVTAKLLNLREIANDSETILIMVDPLEGFRSLADELSAEHIIVGGRQQINPLEIEATPQHVLERTSKLNPYGQRVSSVMGFFTTYFGHIDSAGSGLDKEERAILGDAVHEAYRRQGITTDPATHSNGSPTVIDVFEILGEMAEDVDAFVANAESDLTEVTATESEKWGELAANLRISMRPFTGDGEFDNLAGSSDIDLEGETVSYLDLQQGEADQEIALMLQVLFDTVYERAKQTDKRVILAIDEAHYLMQSEGSLDWLERAYRHSRHHDLSVHLVTQEISDFFVHEKAEVLANESSIKLLQKLPGLSEEHRKKLGLSAREAQFLRDAKPGTRERGYSHALVCVQDKGRYPVKVTALPEEMEIVDPPEDEPNDESAVGSGVTV
ncbi:transfer complex protein (plasmid) [Halorarum halophilum]|uniref:Transfer complex protein n=1 Tax=Halorarum halophilum TaxID=2743090 RepID=A0A7D5GEI8_9EURY|nr:type IV secretory system conjugative DNA transfer family protein [Halobaculum halophilum]QLG29825.1 transfer complex protein [Halobaculum halophilum]